MLTPVSQISGGPAIFHSVVPPLARRRTRRNCAKPAPTATTTPNSTATGSKVSTRSATAAASVPSWSDPRSVHWDIERVLTSDECLAPDTLLGMPPRNYTYIDSNGRLKEPNKYTYGREEKKPHPQLAMHLRNGTERPVNRLYYKDMPDDRCLPIAGIIRETPSTRNSVVGDSAILGVKKEEPKTVLFPGLVKEEILMQDHCVQEESFHARPSIKLTIPDHIKAILVDDWENVTKNQQLVPLPSANPVNKILDDYVQFEQPRRLPGSAQADILEEVVAGLKEYFDKCLGRILLYR